MIHFYKAKTEQCLQKGRACQLDQAPFKKEKDLKNRHVLPTKPKFPPTFTESFAAKL